jgi:predicted lipid-binding transport protein (Tim44 family)
MKKWFIVLMSCVVVFAFSAGAAEAKPRSYKAPSGSFKTTPTKPNSSVSKTDSVNSSKTNATTGTAATGGGFFSGGGFMKGMLVGGLAGMLFGGMFGGLGALGNILGLLVNVMAIFFAFILIRSLINYWLQKRRENQGRHPR